MGLIRRWMVAVVVLLAASVALVAPAGAATGTLHASTRSAAVPRAPFPGCGNHFQLTRASSNVTIVGVGLNAFSSGYMLVYVSAHGKSFGPYNASPYGGARFLINTGTSSKTTISISLTNDTGEVTLCSSDYYA